MSFSGLNFITMFGSAGFIVKFVLLLLLFFSIVSWTIIIIKYRYLKKALNQSVLFTDFFWKNKDFSKAFTKSKQFYGSPVSRVFRSAYLELKKLNRAGVAEAEHSSHETNKEADAFNASINGIAAIKRTLRRAINTETTKMTRSVPFLATTGNTAPFIGLFGTVWGIMNSFHDIGAKGSANLAVVAPGISEALVATAAGLAAAIPAVIAFNYFTQKIRVIESELQSFSTDLLNIIERDILR